MGKDLRAAIQHYFKEFDFAVADAVFEELQKPGGLPRLLKKLGLPAEADSSANYAILIQYFRRKGTKDFLQLVGVEKLDFRIQPTSGQIKTNDGTNDRQRALSGDRNPTNVVPLMLRGESARPRDEQTATRTGTAGSASAPPPPITPLKTPTPIHQQRAQITPPLGSPKPPSPYDKTDENGFPKGPLIAAPPPVPGSFDANTLPYDPSKPHDPTGVWPQVERRSGRERRRQADRRQALEVVYKNRRFGKDRRKGPKERRRNWPPEGFRP